MTKKTRQVWIIIWLIVAISLLFAIFVPNLQIRLSPDKVYSCIARLDSLNKGIMEYVEDHQGKYPEDLNELYPDYISDPSIFWCPSDKQEEPTTIDNSVIDAENSDQISYVYLKENIDNISETSLILKENKSHHGHTGGIIGISKNGTVFLITGEEKEPYNPRKSRWQVFRWLDEEDIVEREKRSYIISAIMYVIVVCLITGIGIIKIKKSGD